MINQLFLELPGIRRTHFSYKFIQDFIFFFIVVAVPSSVFALVPTSIFLDLRLFFFAISFIYFFIYIKYIGRIIRIPGGIALISLNIFLFFEIFINSIILQNLPYREILTIFRTNFFYPITTLSFLFYIASMDNYRIYRFMYWLIISSFLQGVLYIFSNLTKINVFSANDISGYSFNGELILQNMFAIPHYNGIVFIFGFVATIAIKGFNKHWLWFLPLIVVVISIVRSQIIVYLLVMIGSIILMKMSKIKVDFFKFIKLFLVVISFSFVMLLTFPSHVDRVINKFGFDKKEELTQSQYLEEGTFFVRLRLIEDAYTRTENKDNLLFGNGYVREATKGEYDFVVGGDTLIAPVLFTEGFSGLFFRIFPIFLLLVYFFKLFFSPNPKYKLFSIIAIAIILPEIINAVQTKFFVYYVREIFILYILVLVIDNDKKVNQKKENHVT